MLFDEISTKLKLCSRRVGTRKAAIIFNLVFFPQCLHSVRFFLSGGNYDGRRKRVVWWTHNTQWVQKDFESWCTLRTKMLGRGVGFLTWRGKCNFSGQRDRISFIVPGQRTTGQAKNLAKGRDGLGQPKFGTGRAGIAKNRDGTRDKKGNGAEKDVLKQENDILKQKTMFYNRKGCSKTGNLVIFFKKV
jgi:hypothetical protein